MKRIHFTTAALVAAAVLPAACGSKHDDMDRNAGRGSDATVDRNYPPPTTPTDTAPMDDSLRIHRDFQDAVQRRIDEVGREIDELKAKMQTAAEDQKEKFRKLSDDLAKDKDDAVAKLNDLKRQASDKWQDARDKLDKEMTDLEKKATDALNGK